MIYINVPLCFQTLENIKRKQVDKYHKAPEGKKEEIECNPYAIFHQALENCKPVVGLASIQKGGKFYQVSDEADHHHHHLHTILRGTENICSHGRSLFNLSAQVKLLQNIFSLLPFEVSKQKNKTNVLQTCHL